MNGKLPDSLYEEIRQSQASDSEIREKLCKLQRGTGLQESGLRGLCVVDGMLFMRGLAWHISCDNVEQEVVEERNRLIIPNGDYELQDRLVEFFHRHGRLPQNMRRVLGQNFWLWLHFVESDGHVNATLKGVRFDKSHTRHLVESSHKSDL